MRNSSAAATSSASPTRLSACMDSLALSAAGLPAPTMWQHQQQQISALARLTSVQGSQPRAPPLSAPVMRAASGVRVRPGATQLTRMFLGAYVDAALSIRPARAEPVKGAEQQMSVAAVRATCAAPHPSLPPPRVASLTHDAGLGRRDRLVVGDAVPRHGRAAEDHGPTTRRHHALDGGPQDVEAAVQVEPQHLRHGGGGGQVG